MDGAVNALTWFGKDGKGKGKGKYGKGKGKYGKGKGKKGKGCTICGSQWHRAEDCAMDHDEASKSGKGKEHYGGKGKGKGKEKYWPCRKGKAKGKGKTKYRPYGKGKGKGKYQMGARWRRPFTWYEDEWFGDGAWNGDDEQNQYKHQQPYS